MSLEVKFEVFGDFFHSFKLSQHHHRASSCSGLSLQPTTHRSFSRTSKIGLISKKTEKTFSFAYKETFLDYIILETL